MGGRKDQRNATVFGYPRVMANPDATTRRTIARILSIGERRRPGRESGAKQNAITRAMIPTMDMLMVPRAANRDIPVIFIIANV